MADGSHILRVESNEQQLGRTCTWKGTHKGEMDDAGACWLRISSPLHPLWGRRSIRYSYETQMQCLHQRLVWH